MCGLIIASPIMSWLIWICLFGYMGLWGGSKSAGASLSKQGLMNDWEIINKIYLLKCFSN